MQNGARGEQKLITTDIFSPVADSTFPLSLTFLLSVYHGSNASLFKQTSAHVGFIPHRESEQGETLIEK